MPTCPATEESNNRWRTNWNGCGQRCASSANHCESLNGDAAPKDVHKLRTASRRVEAIAGVLESAEGKKSRRLVKAIEPIRKAAGGVRDMDVLLADARKLARYRDGESLNHLVAHLKAARQQNAGELQHALHHRRKAVLEDLKDYSRFVASVAKHAQSNSGAEASRAQEEINSAAMNVIRELGDWKPLDADNLHEFRLKVKQLRYTLQLDAQADASAGRSAGRCAAPHRRLARLAPIRGNRARGARPRRGPRAARSHRAKPSSADSIAPLPRPMPCAENT